MNDDKNLGRLLESFFRERLAAQQQASPHTVKSYRDALKLLLTFLVQRTGKRPSKIELDDIDADAVLAFLDHIEKDRCCGARTRNQRLTALKAFFHYVAFRLPDKLNQARRIIDIPRKRYTKRMLGFLTREEIDAMLGIPDRAAAEGRRDHALLLFMYNTGARVAETVGLDANKLHLVKPYQVLLLGKGEKERVVPLWEMTAQSLDKLLAERGLIKGSVEAVFVNRRHERLNRGGVAFILRRLQMAAAEKCPSLEKKKISPHTIRHTTAMHLLQSGVDLNVIRSWLGHVSLDTTHQYLEADLEMKRQALAKGGISGDVAETASWQPTDDILKFLDSL